MKELTEDFGVMLSKHFNVFEEESDFHINNISIKVMPREEDVPKLKEAYYDAETDILKIVFNSDSPKNRTIDKGYGIQISFDEEEKIIELKINKFKELILKEIVKTLEKPKIKNLPLLKRVVENRKWNFLTEVFTRPLSLF